MRVVCDWISSFFPHHPIYDYTAACIVIHTHTHTQMILHGFSALRNSHSTKLGLFPSLHDMSLNNVHYKHANTHPHTRRATIVFSSHPHILSFKRGLVTYCHCVWARLSVCVCVVFVNALHSGWLYESSVSACVCTHGGWRFSVPKTYTLANSFIFFFFVSRRFCMLMLLSLRKHHHD